MFQILVSCHPQTDDSRVPSPNAGPIEPSYSVCRRSPYTHVRHITPTMHNEQQAH